MITDAKSAAAAFHDAPEEVRDWCRFAECGLDTYVAPEAAHQRLAKVALELGKFRLIAEDSLESASNLRPLFAFLHMMAGEESA